MNARWFACCSREVLGADVSGWRGGRPAGVRCRNEETENGSAANVWRQRRAKRVRCTPGLGLGIGLAAACRWNGRMRVAVAVRGGRGPGLTGCGLRAAIAWSGIGGRYCPNQPCRSLEPPGFGEEHGDEFRLGRREADAYATEALAPPE